MTPVEAAAAMSDESTFQQLAEEVDRAITAAERLDPAARDTAQALRAALERFHKVGLSKIVARLKSDLHGKELLFDLVDEPEVLDVEDEVLDLVFEFHVQNLDDIVFILETSSSISRRRTRSSFSCASS